MSEEPHTSNAPTASGRLDRTPLANLLVYCLDKALTGTIVLESSDGLRHAIYFRQGFAAKVRTGDGFAHLGRVLLELTLIDEDTHNTTLLEMPKQELRHGALLMKLGKIDQNGLMTGLREQLVRKIVHLFELPDDTAYAYYDERNFLESWGGPEIMPTDPLGLVWMGIRARPSDPRVDATLQQLGDQVLKLHVDGDFKRFKLSDRARGVVEMLKARPCSLSELLTAGVATEREVRLVVYTFLITRHLEMGMGKSPVGLESAPDSSSEPGAPSALGRVKLRSIAKPRGAATEVAGAPQARGPLPSSPHSPEMEARRQEIRERAESIEKDDYFVMLGVDRECGNDVMQGAYFQLAKRWHPDRLPEELADVRDIASRVFARINDAFQTLTDEGKRAQYLEALKGGVGSPEEHESVTRAIEAQMDFQKAEILLKKGDVAGATKWAQKADQRDPGQADYQALVGWLRATAVGAEQAAVLEVVEELAAVLAREPNHQRALWYHGCLLKKLGNEDRAVKDFRKLLELDARHVDAQREVRLFEMRHRGEKPARPSTSDARKTTQNAGKLHAEASKPKDAKEQLGELFGKLFKK